MCPPRTPAHLHALCAVTSAQAPVRDAVRELCEFVVVHLLGIEHLGIDSGTQLGRPSQHLDERGNLGRALGLREPGLHSGPSCGSAQGHDQGGRRYCRVVCGDGQLLVDDLVGIPPFGVAPLRVQRAQPGQLLEVGGVSLDAVQPPDGHGAKWQPVCVCASGRTWYIRWYSSARLASPSSGRRRCKASRCWTRLARAPVSVGAVERRLPVGR